MSPKGLHLRWRLGLWKFCFLTPVLRLRAMLSGTACEFGTRISLQGSLRIRGPGKVIIEDDVIIADRVDLYTHTRQAVLRIGAGSYLNGTRISCSESVEIGTLNVVADARIMDTDFHWPHKDRHIDRRPPPCQPVKTEKNVWIAANAALLKGTVIGENSVLAFGGITSAKIPANEIWGGSPAKKISDLPASGLSPKSSEST